MQSNSLFDNKSPAQLGPLASKIQDAGCCVERLLWETVVLMATVATSTQSTHIHPSIFTAFDPPAMEIENQIGAINAMKATQGGYKRSITIHNDPLRFITIHYDPVWIEGDGRRWKWTRYLGSLLGRCGGLLKLIEELLLLADRLEQLLLPLFGRSFDLHLLHLELAGRLQRRQRLRVRPSSAASVVATSVATSVASGVATSGVASSTVHLENINQNQLIGVEDWEMVAPDRLCSSCGKNRPESCGSSGASSALQRCRSPHPPHSACTAIKINVIVYVVINRSRVVVPIRPPHGGGVVDVDVVLIVIDEERVHAPAGFGVRNPGHAGQDLIDLKLTFAAADPVLIEAILAPSPLQTGAAGSVIDRRLALIARLPVCDGWFHREWIQRVGSIPAFGGGRPPDHVVLGVGRLERRPSVDLITAILKHLPHLDSAQGSFH